MKFSETEAGKEFLKKFINTDTTYIHALGCNKVIDDRQVKLMFIPVMDESYLAGIYAVEKEVDIEIIRHGVSVTDWEEGYEDGLLKVKEMIANLRVNYALTH